MFEAADNTQLTLFAGRRPDPEPRRRVGRNEKMARRLDHMADDAELEAEACRAQGDQLGERRFREQARDARRSAALLRAGPEGVARLLAS
ncbi:MAG: hypothetical protein IT200_09805 [Thermoleophilia bacterium]|nr:hypothetical protein [Thermoleophilia bacterium]